jgi:hypothetical protein
MTTLSGYATSIAPVNEILSAYASGAYEPVLFASDAPMVVFGAFTVPSLVSARLSVSGCKSGSATLLVRLYADGAATTCQVYVTSAAETVFLTPAFDFAPNVLYQVAAQFLGSASCAAVRNVSLSP